MMNIQTHAPRLSWRKKTAGTDAIGKSFKITGHSWTTTYSHYSAWTKDDSIECFEQPPARPGFVMWTYHLYEYTYKCIVSCLETRNNVFIMLHELTFMFSERYANVPRFFFFIFFFFYYTPKHAPLVVFLFPRSVYIILCLHHQHGDRQ